MRSKKLTNTGLSAFPKFPVGELGIFPSRCHEKRYKGATQTANFVPLLPRLSSVREEMVYVIDAFEKSRTCLTVYWNFLFEDADPIERI